MEAVVAETAATVVLEDKVSMRIHFSYDGYEMTVISQSFEQGFSAFEINVKLRDDCLLKAARVYMVFEILEKSGEIIKSEPKVERLENEDFDEKFTVALITKEDADVLKAKVMKVSEIEKCDCHTCYELII